ncbi:hypothetical protein DRH27_02825 [Candidatus Falkowbacteria bacterium]|nr:MAG: hypothetical protein DRH27_02825 [Candidatus Falkowbacteria bacterium]
MTVKEIVKKYLQDNEYDGLCNTDCGCTIDDLIPCCENSDDCLAGYKSECDPETCPADGDCDFHISAEKPGIVLPEKHEPGEDEQTYNMSIDFSPTPEIDRPLDASFSAEVQRLKEAWKKLISQTLFQIAQAIF